MAAVFGRLTRRQLLKLLGGGVVMVVALDRFMAQTWRRAYPEDFNAYLVIAPDGRVTVYSGKIEMGQGVLTSQAQMVAEELGVPLAAIDMVLGDTERCPWDMGTFGSLTTRMFGPALRAAAAKARLAMLTLGAQRLGMSLEQLEAADGFVAIKGEPQRRVSYGDLAKGARITQQVSGKEVLKAARDFSVMGRSPVPLDGIAKATGAAKFTGDLRLPGMLYARVLRPPAHGARLQRVDESAALAVAGARWVRDGDLMAVLHADARLADVAFERLKAQWTRPTAKVDPESIHAHVVKASGELDRFADRGNVEAARTREATRIAHEFRKGYVAHAPLETHAALAQVSEGRATVWASTQTPFPTRDRIARALGLSASAVRVIAPPLGGGFGGKSEDTQAVEAARLSKATGQPVMVMRTRAEEFFLDTYDPAAVVQIESGLDAQGRIAYWHSRVYGCGDRGAELLYDVPDLRIEVAGGISYAPPEGDAPPPHPFATGPWRAPGANMNIYAIESQVDALAAAARADPVEFRLRHLRDERMRRVLKAAADAFGWRPAPAPSGRGFGIACSMDAGTCVATIAHVAVEPATGRVQVQRMVCAQDMGIVVNPEGAKMQIEGGLVMGLGYTLTEELRFSGGAIHDRNFDTYRIPRFSDVPRIEAVLVTNDELAPQGGGEPSITTVGGSVANAVFDVTGVRMTRLPMTAERVQAALKAGSGGRG